MTLRIPSRPIYSLCLALGPLMLASAACIEAPPQVDATTKLEEGHDAAHHWAYSGVEGPSHWGEIDAHYSLCSQGKNQSPIDLKMATSGPLPDIRFDYKKGGDTVVNNGHTVQVHYAPGSTISVDGRSFELKQMHFHSPSENTIDGVHFAMEAHLVHADKDGELAVLAVMFKEGAAHTELEKAWKQMPEQLDAKVALREFVDAHAIVPKDHHYFRFNGSLTTPPCTEGVAWFVMKGFDTASASQIEKFKNVLHHPNNRPVQELHARIVVQ